MISHTDDRLAASSSSFTLTSPGLRPPTHAASTPPPPPWLDDADHHHDNTFLHWVINDHHHPLLDLDDVDLDYAKPAPFFFADRGLHHHHPASSSFPNPKPTADDNTSTVEQLVQAAKLTEAGDVLAARHILARPAINYRLPASAAPPLLRSALYFKDALRRALISDDDDSSSSTPPPPLHEPHPHDLLLKLTAYKSFSDLSPLLHFAHFTCVQAVLDELAPSASCIHLLDFDIGVGEQWASLMHDLAHRHPGVALKVTALNVTASSSSHHPLQLQLIHDTLSTFAADLSVPFRFAAFNLDATDLTPLLAVAAATDAIAVHLPVGSVHATAVPSVLHLVRRLGAKLVVSVDRGCDRGELPFAAHLLQALRSTVSLLESLDAMGTDSDVAAKIERFWVQPKIQECVRAAVGVGGDKTAASAWRATLASAGFVPVQVSSMAEAQAESLLKKLPVRGFRLERRAGSLFLHWQRGELASVSAWRC
ncbi:scarecrow-like protein 6 [Oryza glaberrima]|uniref:scarecrow-like protein 6 n=1 Tax=Oryza glaberrima TaxID=4538 RepID=UPI00224C1C3C|nr:scarecrow-like protein 6 [Oryza glaberrima]